MVRYFSWDALRLRLVISALVKLFSELLVELVSDMGVKTKDDRTFVWQIYQSSRKLDVFATKTPKH
jgi:hypothetical protein